jgi:hypothetical protein
MESTTESTEYDLFDYRHADEIPLPLDEAIRKASALRAADKSHFQRIVPVDQDGSGFRVEAVSKDQAYADMVARANDLVNRLLRRIRQR